MMIDDGLYQHSRHSQGLKFVKPEDGANMSTRKRRIVLSDGAKLVIS
jgi:hypothetical protein